MEFNVGPVDGSVLYRQGTHISSVISADNLDKTLRVRRSDNLISKLCKDGIIHNRVFTRLNQMGLYGIIRCGFFKYDNHLITALVERWRRETHTFHLRGGEATITLQDVELVWNLNINGIPVTGVDRSRKPNQWRSYCAELLGFLPSTDHFRGNKLLMTALDQYCRARLIDAESSNVEVDWYCRSVALMIIGGCMLPDSDGCSVNLMYLHLLQDIDQVSNYSWGSAVLAFLYRELCNASSIGKGEIAGPLFILQVWARSRMTFLCPDPFGDIPDDDDHIDQILPFPPFGERWNRYFTWTHTITHSVRVIRDLLDKMEPNQFKWVLYPQEFVKDYWQSVCPLICFNIVEMHRPDRVLRQFGQLQHIPSPVLDGDDFHECTRQGRQNYDWAKHHKNSIEAWNDRLSLIVQGAPVQGNMGITREYAIWYDNITRRIITPVQPQADYGYRPGDAHFRRAMRNDAEVLRSWFHGLSLQDQPRDALEAAIIETRQIGDRLCEMLDRTVEPLQFQEVPQQHHFHEPPHEHHFQEQPQPQEPLQQHHFQEPPQQYHFQVPPHPHFEPRRMQWEESSSSYSYSDQQISHGEFDDDAGPSQTVQTPNEPYIPSFTDMLSGEYGRNEFGMNINYNTSPIPFPRYSDIWSASILDQEISPNFVQKGVSNLNNENVNEEDTDDENVTKEDTDNEIVAEEGTDDAQGRRRGKRKVRRTKCGTGGCL